MQTVHIIFLVPSDTGANVNIYLLVFSEIARTENPHTGGGFSWSWATTCVPPYECTVLSPYVSGDFPLFNKPIFNNHAYSTHNVSDVDRRDERLLSSRSALKVAYKLRGGTA